MLTLKSLNTGLTCTGYPETYSKILFNYINPSYKGTTGKVILDCNGSSVYLIWNTPKIRLTNFEGKARDVYGAKMSYYLSDNKAEYEKMLEEYTKVAAMKPSPQKVQENTSKKVSRSKKNDKFKSINAVKKSKHGKSNKS